MPEKNINNIKFAYLNNSMGDETMQQKKKQFQKKLEVLGIDEKLAAKIFKNHTSTKKKRLKSIIGKRESSSRQHCNLMSSKKNVNAILKKRANQIGKK